MPTPSSFFTTHLVAIASAVYGIRALTNPDRSECLAITRAHLLWRLVSDLVPIHSLVI